MRTDTAPTLYRKDYQPFPYAVLSVALEFDLDAESTTVRSRLEIERLATEAVPLVLDGEALELVSLAIDGSPLQADAFHLDDEHLTVFPSTERFVLEITNRCKPSQNTSLMGLYVSGNSLFTQCEAQGFRRITWFPDRPDVMSRYRVTLKGDAQRYPLLLSNGNLLTSRLLEDGRHECTWEDPHPKPCYLFALVAGHFDCRETTVQTKSGRQALLQVYCDPGDRSQTEWALDCLERSVLWDEQRFGLELDLDRFMVVAARDFNMGAMENKGLNIFNSAYVLADPDTASDTSFEAIESVIGHEYFHNWTGNRVTCRDWFQLSLKEGLTVFRDQEFSADMRARGLPDHEAASARAVKRIDDVMALRVAQFPEDAGPMAHPIRPDSYQEIGNFYTATVYEKGAEVIRMQHTLLGEDGFQAGMREYFRRHDGSAVTCDDFVDAMDSVYRAQHPGQTLDIFRNWYAQAGTPRVKVELEHNPETATCILTLSQRCAPAGVEKLSVPPAEKVPLHIPFALGLLDPEGADYLLQADGQQGTTVVLNFTQASQQWTFTGIANQPTPSLLRHFSAPVIVEYDYTDQELARLAQADSDPFARWEAGQELATRVLLAAINEGSSSNDITAVTNTLVQTWKAIAADTTLSAAYLSRILTLPSERILIEKCNPADPQAVANARDTLRLTLARELQPSWTHLYQQCTNTLSSQTYTPDPVSSGLRALRNLALGYLVMLDTPEIHTLAEQHYEQASNMTDRMGALSALVSFGRPEKARIALDSFYTRYEANPLVIDRWFALQATSPRTTVAEIRALMNHKAFTLRNPNRARALLFQFCLNNLRGVHGEQGYDFWADQVLALDALNPEVAARLARAFDNWQRFAEPYRNAVRMRLERIQAHEGLSRNVSEIITKALTL